MLSRNRKGFTLVELSIVLVIIGLIIGAVLTGQQIIQSARITNTLNTVQAYQAQFQTYVQNYGAIPGDDAGAPTRFSGNVAKGSRNGDGVIQGLFDTTTDTDEARLVWADLRAAGLVKNQITGTNSTAVQPPNPFNGVYGIQNGAFAAASDGGFTTTVLCLSKVPGAAALAIDTRLDDGVSNTGSVRAIANTNDVSNTPSTSYDVTQTYSLCVKM